MPCLSQPIHACADTVENAANDGNLMALVIFVSKKRTSSDRACVGSLCDGKGHSGFLTGCSGACCLCFWAIGIACIWPARLSFVCWK